MDRIDEAVSGVLSRLPECRADAAALRAGLEYFGADVNALPRAAAALETNHDLRCAGVMKLLSLWLEDFASLLERRAPFAELSVPAPPALVYALHYAFPELRFMSAAMAAQIALRGVFLHTEPVDLSATRMRRCGLNSMRRRIAAEFSPRAVLQFGVLCDECCKACEGADGALSLVLPRGVSSAAARSFAAGYIGRLEAFFGRKITPEAKRRGFGLYSRLLSAERRIAAVCAARSCLRGNSLALAQFTLLASPSRPEEAVAALEELAGELEAAPAARDYPGKRLYCFIVPFLQPAAAGRFMDAGVFLTGGGAFIELDAGPFIDLAGSVAAWAEAMAVRRPEAEYAAALAADIRRWGCGAYLGGSFNFDRALGAAEPLRRRILKREYGIASFELGADFWSENCGWTDPAARAETISAMMDKQ